MNLYVVVVENFQVVVAAADLYVVVDTFHAYAVAVVDDFVFVVHAVDVVHSILFVSTNTHHWDHPHCHHPSSSLSSQQPPVVASVFAEAYLEKKRGCPFLISSWSVPPRCHRHLRQLHHPCYSLSHR